MFSGDEVLKASLIGAGGGLLIAMLIREIAQAVF